MDNIMRMAKLRKVESQVASDPDDHEGLVKCVSAARSEWIRSGASPSSRSTYYAERLAAAREELHKRFVLSKEQWLEWVEDIDDVGKRIDVLKNFVGESIGMKGLEEVYMALIEEVSEGGAPQNAIIDLYEEMVSRCGMHYSDGVRAWENYREFAEVRLAEEDDSDAKVRELYRRQLRVPHLQLESTWESYAAWEVDDAQRTAMRSHFEETQDLVRARRSFEKKVADDPKSPSHWLDYIWFERSKGDVSRAQYLCSRAVQTLLEPQGVALEANPPCAAVWSAQLVIASSMKSLDGVKKIGGQAVRCCRCSLMVWKEYLQSLVHSQATYGDLDEATSSVSAKTFCTGSAYAGFLCAKVQCLVALCSRPHESKLQHTITSTLDTLIDGEHLAFVPTVVHAMASANVSDGTMKAVRQSLVSLEGSLIAMEFLGAIAAAWESVELSRYAQSGNFDFVRKCQAASKKEARRIDAEASLCSIEWQLPTASFVSKKSHQAERRERQQLRQAEEKTEEHLRVTANQDKTLFVWNLPFSVTEEDIKTLLGAHCTVTAVRIVKKSNGESKGRAYVDVDSEDSMRAGVAKDLQSIHGRKVRVQRSGHGKTRPEEREKQPEPPAHNSGAKMTFGGVFKQGIQEEPKIVPQSNADFASMM